MRIASVTIQNFRSIRRLTLACGDRTVLVGPNNHGKSNILTAIEFGLTPGFKIRPEDFFAFCDEADGVIAVELTFTDLTDQERTTFSKYVRSDGTVCVRKTAETDAEGGMKVEYHGYVEQPGQWWLKVDAFDRLRSRDLITAEAAEVPVLEELLQEAGRVTKDRVGDWQTQYIEAHRDELQFQEALEPGPFMGTKNVAGGVLPDLYLIPAVRDLGDEVKTSSQSTFGRLLNRAVSDMADSDPRFGELQQGLRTLIEELNKRPDGEGAELNQLGVLEQRLGAEMADWGVGVRIEVAPPEVKKVFELGTELWIDDGHETSADLKGHGLQRALIFGLIKAWAASLREQEQQDDARSRAASESVVFAFEEPELFLHPQAQRVLARALRQIAGTADHQVLLCTHSPHFVDLDDYNAIAVVEKESAEAGTGVHQCNTDLFEGEGSQDRKDRFHMASWINPDRGELFFARKTVLVEGETEQAALPYVASRLGCLDNQVSIIDCGSKHNLPLYMKILNAFSIPYVVVYDEDPLPDAIPRDWNEAKVKSKKRTYALNAEITALAALGPGECEMCAPDFEGIAGISHNQGQRKGKALAALDHLGSLDIPAIPTRVVELVQKAYE